MRLRTRAQIILLAGEQQMIAPAIAKIVREHEQTVRNWFKRWMRDLNRGSQRSTDAWRARQSHEHV